MKKLNFKGSTMKHIIFTVLIAFMIIGCNSQDTNNADSTDSSVSKETALKLNIKTEVNSGDIYTAKSLDAKIDIEHDIINNKRYITLVQGKGSITSK